MQFKTVLLTLASIAVARAQDATEATNNPTGVSYQAILPDSDDTNVRGYLAGVTATNGTGVELNINFYGFDTDGPFIYYIADAAVGDNGDCTGLKVLDPYGGSTTCDTTKPASCELGDLSGQYGQIIPSPFQKAFYDPYLSTMPDTEGFFGNRSFAIAHTNGSTLTCGNFKLVAGDPTGSPTSSASSSGVASSTATPTSNAAVTKAAIGSTAVLAGLLGLFL